MLMQDSRGENETEKCGKLPIHLLFQMKRAAEEQIGKTFEKQCEQKYCRTMTVEQKTLV